jgi:hypothetical protein
MAVMVVEMVKVAMLPANNHIERFIALRTP